ncbi:cytochrome c oxidase subunit 3 [Streptococcus suis]
MSHKVDTIDSRTHEGNLNKLGFWIFLTAEFALFGTLFATLLTLQHGGGYGGMLTTELFELPLVLIMTFLLLASSYTCGIAIYYMRKEKKNLLMIWMIITILLGIGFVGFEIFEFAHYAHEGANPTIGSYWSSFFILLGTHGAHETGRNLVCRLLLEKKKKFSTLITMQSVLSIAATNPTVSL